MDDLPPHNPVKLPFFCLTALGGLALLIVGALRAEWAVVVIGGVDLLASSYFAWLVHRGYRSRWLQAPLDKRWPRQ